MVRNFLIGLVLVSGLALMVISSDINGKWKGKMEGPNGEVGLVFTFKAEGDTLAGNVEGPMGTMDISNGKINGDDFSFDLSFGGMTINHECKVLGDSISMKVPGMQGEDIEIILKRLEENK